MQKRKKYPAELKARVALPALRGVVARFEN